ncbi:MAG: Uma2 family endonuclease, partial [Gemmatimonas sp.]
MIPAPVLMTAEDLLARPVPYRRTELVNGRLMVREPAGWTHGDIAARIMGALTVHLRVQQRESGEPTPHGRLLAAETGFALQRNPDTVRAPDVAFVRWERCPSEPPA